MQGSRKLKEGSVINLSFVMPDGVRVDDLKCLVQNSRMQGDNCLAGVRFVAEDNPALAAVEAP